MVLPAPLQPQASTSFRKQQGGRQSADAQLLKGVASGRACHDAAGALR
jgi:hypothetical protein